MFIKAGSIGSEAGSGKADRLTYCRGCGFFPRSNGELTIKPDINSAVTGFVVLASCDPIMANVSRFAVPLSPATCHERQFEIALRGRGNRQPVAALPGRRPLLQRSAASGRCRGQRRRRRCRGAIGVWNALGHRRHVRSRRARRTRMSPKLERFDARGFRRDVVTFHPAYHHFMAESIAAGLHASTWDESAAPRTAPAQVARAARFYMAAQVETGHLCPITMTRAAVAALAAGAADRRQVHAQDRLPFLRFPVLPMVAEGRHDARNGHDREAGRHRCAHQHDICRARRRGLRHHRPQVVHVGAYVRRVSGAGAGARRPDLFPDAAFSPRWAR